MLQMKGRIKLNKNGYILQFILKQMMLSKVLIAENLQILLFYTTNKKNLHF